MNDYELIKLLLNTTDALRLIREEVHRRWKTGHAVLQDRPEVHKVRTLSDNLAGAMAEVAARLAVTLAPPPAPPPSP